MKKEYESKIYAGVLGKILGVYRGRPVEGWTYNEIKNRFNEIYTYKNHITGAPLIVADDDISGTFTFYRALEDSGYNAQIKAKEIGEAWLNYIIENKTILWWGGLCRSTEHSAYLRLKNGIDAPDSGSIYYNGRGVAEQIGSQIFIDAWAMVNPGNPLRAATMAREAALVSHDGIAVECAVFLAAMEAIAFEERDVCTIISKARPFIGQNEYGQTLNQMLDDVISHCESCNDWRQVLAWLQENYGYERFGGCCPMVPNHLLLIMTLLCAGDDFNKSLMIASSAGWDTDCNAGNVGCLNGIRLGLNKIEETGIIRHRVDDRMYVVNADGGSCITDAVIEARKIIKAAYILDNQPAPDRRGRFEFEFPGSVQGFAPYDINVEEQTMCKVENAFKLTGETGLLLQYEGLSKGYHASACVHTFIDLKPKAKEDTSQYNVICSPTLYSGQTITVIIFSENDKNPNLQLFLDYFNIEDKIETVESNRVTIEKGNNTFYYEVPDLKGHAIYRLGIRLTSDDNLSGHIVIKSIDWSNTPKRFCIGKARDMTLNLTCWDLTTSWLKMFVSSMSNFYPDAEGGTFILSNVTDNGLAVIGTRDWTDYSVKSRITNWKNNGVGLVARSCGLNQYYAGVLEERAAKIICHKGRNVYVLAETPFDCTEGSMHDLEFTVKGSALHLFIDGTEVVSCNDNKYHCGSAGFVINSGTALADGFAIERL